MNDKKEKETKSRQVTQFESELIDVLNECHKLNEFLLDVGHELGFSDHLNAKIRTLQVKIQNKVLPW